MLVASIRRFHYSTHDICTMPDGIYRTILLLQMYSEGNAAVQANNKTAFDYFKKASDKVSLLKVRTLTVFRNILLHVHMTFLSKHFVTINRSNE